MGRASLLTFSGIDCCGKSTQIELLESSLRAAGRRPICLWVRGGYTPRLTAARTAVRRLMGKKAFPAGHTAQRQAFMKRAGRRHFWLRMAILDLIVECVLRVRWLRLMGRTVICDRSLDDTEIDFAIHFPEDHVADWRSWRLLRRLAAKPDAAFLLDLSFEESARRSREKNEPFPEADEQRRVRAQFYAAAKQKRTWLVIDALSDIERIHREIVRQIAETDRPASGDSPKGGR